jgi:hypothetical protein
MLLFLGLIFLAGACYHAKSWKQLLRNIVIAETILIIGLLVGVAVTAQIDSDLPNMHRDYTAVFLGNLLLDTMLIFGAGFGPYALKKVFARRHVASLSPDDETSAPTKYWKTGVSLVIVVVAVSWLLLGLGLLYVSFFTWTQPQPWTASDHEFFPWALGFGIVFLVGGGVMFRMRDEKKLRGDKPAQAVINEWHARLFAEQRLSAEDELPDAHSIPSESSVQPSAETAHLIFKGIIFCAGFSATLALEMLLLFCFQSIAGHHRQIIPIGLVWVFAPISVGVATANSTERLKAFLTRNAMLQNKLLRQIVVILVAWTLGCFSVFYIMQPYGDYVSSSDWRNFTGWLFIPQAVVVFVVVGLKYAGAVDRQKQE